ncbi:hypothetical protein DN069_21435 [Streptacidiphilus pinicola]|uniref:Uncharacterized protein n=2 Tax=Streptacidiphilus pinicola TaxID=2219663 RepID=A0A2X0IJI3_9ACTN|nr:hypothetical protein DN069_21435 [Streptacidiphilus pinicola]
MPAPRSDSPAAWQRDAQEAARYAQHPPMVVNNYYSAPARRGPDVREVLGWTAVLGVVAGVLLAVAMTAVALGLAAVALAVLAVILRGLWRDLRGGK